MNDLVLFLLLLLLLYGLMANKRKKEKNIRNDQSQHSNTKMPIDFHISMKCNQWIFRQKVFKLKLWLVPHQILTFLICLCLCDWLSSILFNELFGFFSRFFLFTLRVKLLNLFIICHCNIGVCECIIEWN